MGIYHIDSIICYYHAINDFKWGGYKDVLTQEYYII